MVANPKAKILIIGQAPGTKIHKTGIPLDDPSGKQLRKWLDVTDTDFYDDTEFTIVPMSFYYLEKGKGGDLLLRLECAPQWHKLFLDKMPKLELVILIGIGCSTILFERKS